MVAFLKTHAYNTIPLVTPDRRALREALAAQQQQQVVKQERVLQSLVGVRCWSCSGLGWCCFVEEGWS